MTKVHRLFAILACLPLLSAPLYGGDLAALSIEGDVAEVTIVRANGAYLETLLGVWSYDPAAPLQPLLLRCNGLAGGTLANCLYPTAFLGCTRTVITSPDPYEPTLTYEKHVCTGPARRDAGECVNLLAAPRPLDIFRYQVFADGHDRIIQALSLDVLDVGYDTGCTSKP